MTRSPTREEYIRILRSLSGKAFEREVCDLLQETILSFQPVPDRGTGDGGLDGLSHAQTISYCCFGPEPQEDRRKRLKRMVDKFRADLRRLLELKTSGRALEHDNNDVLEGILAKSARIKVVRCVVNVFDDNKLIGRLNDAANKLRAASKCRFVERDFSLVVWGPEDLTAKVLIDEAAVLRATNARLAQALDALDEPGAQLPEGQKEEFDSKFEYLRLQAPEKSKTINVVQREFRDHWSRMVAFEEELLETSPRLHQDLLRARRSASSGASILRLRTSDDSLSGSMGLLESVEAKVREGVEAHLPRIGSGKIDQITKGECARLVGECPLDWRPE